MTTEKCFNQAKTDDGVLFIRKWQIINFIPHKNVIKSS